MKRNNQNHEDSDITHRKVLINSKTGKVTELPRGYDFRRDNKRLEELYGKNYYNILAGIGDQ